MEIIIHHISLAEMIEVPNMDIIKSPNGNRQHINDTFLKMFIGQTLHCR